MYGTYSTHQRYGAVTYCTSLLLAGSGRIHSINPSLVEIDHEDDIIAEHR